MLDSPLCHSAEDETGSLYDLWLNDRYDVNDTNRVEEKLSLRIQDD
jgi:hypothetical protein